MQSLTVCPVGELLGSWCRGHNDPGRPQDALVESEAGFENADHRSRRHILARFVDDCLVEHGVEGLALGVNTRYAEAAQNIEQLRLYQGYSLDKRALFAGLAGRLPR
jgi:hypothetical protein